MELLSQTVLDSLVDKIAVLDQNGYIMKKTTYTDELTGLFNRRFFNKKLEEEYNNNIESNTDFSLLAIDIDQFKKYNDAYGHQQGDECLIQVAKALKQYVRETDLVCRTGGEEFCILLPNTGKEVATSLAKRVCTKVEELKIKHSDSEVSHYVTVSIGLSTETESKPSHRSPEELFASADKALYKAKESGRNQVKL
jgi:diguanylate cyclase (GGDEF)-like protein